jgi:hypothetical protein
LWYGDTESSSAHSLLSFSETCQTSEVHSLDVRRARPFGVQLENQTKSNWCITIFALAVLILAASSLATAQPQDQAYTVGESIEVKWVDTWLKATIIEERNGGYVIKYDVDGVQNFVTKDRMRPLAGAKRPTPPAPAQPQNETAPAQPGKPQTANKYKIGDRVQCDRTDMQAWETGTVVPLRKTDLQDGRVYRVLLDSYSKAGLYLDGHDCTVERMRPLAGAAPFKGDTPVIPVGKVTIDDENTVSADRPIMECPVPQTKVKNGAGPDIELFKKIIRCRKGEKPAARKGADGAVTIEVTSLVPGGTRPWEYGRDMGGKPGTIIHPVKATFHYKTFYRSSTQVSQNWISIINFYVNAFGEWETGSEESIKMGDTINVPRQQ